MIKERTFVVLPDVAYEKLYIEMTMKHIQKHFNDSEISFVCFGKNGKGYKGLFSPLFIVDAEVLKLDELPLLKEGTRVILIANADGKSSMVTWSKSFNLDIYKNYLHGFGGLRKERYRPFDKPVFKLQKQNTFHKIADKTNDGMIFFPYLNFSYIYSKFGQEVNHEYGYRVSDDYQKYRHRNSKTKLIVFTGGSACYGFCSFIGERFTDFLQDLLNKNTDGYEYIVLNFAFENHQILNEIFTYILFCMELKPDIVISFSGANDLVHGMLSDNFLQKKFAVANQIELEVMAQRITGDFNSGLPHLKRNGFPITNAAIVIKAFYSRLLQYRQLVQSQGSKFFSILQPTVYSKRQMSNIERELMKQHISIINSRMQNMKNAIVNPSTVRYMMDRFSDLIGKKDIGFIYDFHQEINKFDSNVTIFSDTIHFGPEGERCISKLLYEIIIKDHARGD